MYLHRRLLDRCVVKVIPGVSSLMACASVAGLPLAARNAALTVVPAPLPDDELRFRLAGDDSFAIIKVGRHLGRLRGMLDERGLLARSWYVERATLATQRVCRLGELHEEQAPYFSMILVTSVRGGR
jgi:precorrin-2/cobalt-factor-2 C20-methyltransferase